MRRAAAGLCCSCRSAAAARRARSPNKSSSCAPRAWPRQAGMACAASTDPVSSTTAGCNCTLRGEQQKQGASVSSARDLRARPGAGSRRERTAPEHCNVPVARYQPGDLLQRRKTRPATKCFGQRLQVEQRAGRSTRFSEPQRTLCRRRPYEGLNTKPV